MYSGTALNPPNRNDREDLLERDRQALEFMEPPARRNRKPFTQEYNEQRYQRAIEACEAAQRLLTSGDASELTVVLHADEVHGVMNQLCSVLGGR